MFCIPMHSKHAVELRHVVQTAGHAFYLHIYREREKKIPKQLSVTEISL